MDAEASPEVVEETPPVEEDVAQDDIDEMFSAEAAVEEELSSEAEADEDIVELTEIVDEPAEENFDEVLEDVSAEEPPEDVVAPMPEPEVEPEPAIVEDVINKIDEEVLSNSAQEVASSAFSQLAKKAAVDRTGLISIEDIVREEMRPILRTWVDDHLPKMLERLLQEELDKIAKRAMED